MHKFSLIVGFLACFCNANEARALDAGKAYPAEIIGAYGGAGTNFQHNGTLNLGFRLRGLKYCPLGLELINMLPMGTEIAVQLYLVNIKPFKLHVIPPFFGVYLPWQKKPMSVEWLKRRGAGVDLVVGIGAEYQFAAKGALADFGFSFISVGIDWRMFAPNLTWVLPNWGDMGKRIYKQSAKEGELWFGVTFWR